MTKETYVQRNTSMVCLFQCVTTQRQLNMTTHMTISNISTLLTKWIFYSDSEDILLILLILTLY